MHTANELVDRLEHVITGYVLGAMPADPTGDLAAQPLADLLITYATWRSRLVPARPRRTHRSRELQADPNAIEHKVALDAIVAKIEAGGDLTPHLSRGVLVAHEPGTQPAKLAGRRDRDLLISDWGVHHLHLSTTLEPDGFVERTADLLFAAFKVDDAYLINVFAHGSWALAQVLEIVVRNWPDAGLLHETMGTVGLSQHWTDDERLQLRKAGVTGPIEIDGRVYMPPGQTIAGTPAAATRRAMTITHVLHGLRDSADELRMQLAKDVTVGRAVSHDWEPVVYDDLAGLRCGEAFVPLLTLI